MTTQMEWLRWNDLVLSNNARKEELVQLRKERIALREAMRELIAALRSKPTNALTLREQSALIAAERLLKP